jgi:hypothetical protein
MESRTFRAVIFHRDGWYVAQVLEVDIAVQARTPQDLDYELQRAIVGRLVVGAELGREPFAGLRPAPERFEQLWREAVPARVTVRFEVQPEVGPVPLLDARTVAADLPARALA